MIVVAGTATLKPGALANASPMVEQVVAATRRETGCHSYTFYADLADPDKIHVFEEWESEEALLNHLRQPHTQQFLGAIGEHLSGPPDIKRYDVTSVAKLI